MRIVNKLKEIKVKYCVYYCDDLISLNDVDFWIILVSEMSYEDLSIYYTRYEITYITKDLCIIFQKINGYIKD